MTVEPGFGGQSFLNDQVEKIKNISHYISHINGGQGCVRDIIVQTLKAQDSW